MILKFLTTYWLDVLTVVLFLIALIVLYRKKRTDLVQKLIFSLVVEAEKALGSKTGEAKYAAVLCSIYKRLPVLVRFLFTRDDFDRFIEESVARLKKMLSEDKIDLLSYSEEKEKR